VSAYLITGRGGSGKSAIREELVRRGLPAFDADRVPDLCHTIDRVTRRETKVDWSGYVDYSKVAWDWDETVLRDFLTKHDQLYLCGSASNQLPFHKLFNKVFTLQLDSNTHRGRLRSRDSVYGKHPDMEKDLVNEQQLFTRLAIAQGAIAIDASQPLTKLVDEILRVNE
jgi:hypothetical protein